MDDATINRTIAERLYAVAYLPARTDFASSLDAMAEAEASLTAKEWWEYTDHFWYSYETPWETARRCLIAPARTRALAFIDATNGREANRG